MPHCLLLLFMFCLANPCKVLEAIDWISPTRLMKSLQVTWYGAMILLMKWGFLKYWIYKKLYVSAEDQSLSSRLVIHVSQVWWLSDTKEVLLEMLAYVSKILAIVQFNKEVFHCYRIIIPHLWPSMCVYYKDLRLRKTSESPIPAPDLIMLPFTICVFYSWRMKEGKHRKMITGGREKLCTVFHWLITEKM